MQLLYQSQYGRYVFIFFKRKLKITLARTLTTGFIFALTVSAGSSQTFSKAVTAGPTFTSDTSGAVISVPNSDNYRVYLFNQGNYTLYNSVGSATCINSVGCGSSINSGWSFNYTCPASGTYYLVLVCKNSELPCTFDLNVNYAGLLLSYL